MYKIVFILSFVTILLNSCSNQDSRRWQGECSKPLDIGLIEIMPTSDHNALRGIIAVQAATKTDCYIRYWENSSTHDSVIYYSPLSKDKKQHELMLVNLKPATKYKFNVVVQNSVCKTYSKTYELTSPHLPAWIPFYSIEDSLSKIPFDGYIHFHSRRNPGYLFIVNSNGDIIWYNNLPISVKVSKFTRKSTFLTILSDDTLRFSSGKKIAEVDLFGQLLYHFDSDEKGIDRIFHHEIDYDKNGNIMTLIYDTRVVDLSEVGGGVKDTVRGDAILIMNKKDSVVWKWSVFDVLDPKDYDNILNEKDDWLHANALIKDSIGNYLVSFRNISEIWKIDGKTGALIWRLGGDKSDFLLPDSAKFYGQHNIHFNKNGDLVLLDNGNVFVKPGLQRSDRRLIYNDKSSDKKRFLHSRLLTFSIDEKNKEAKLVDEVIFPPGYFTKSQGSTCYINDSLVLFCSTNNNKILLTSPEGKVSAKVPLEYTSYRAQYIKELYPTDYVK